MRASALLAAASSSAAGGGGGGSGGDGASADDDDGDGFFATCRASVTTNGYGARARLRDVCPDDDDIILTPATSHIHLSRFGGMSSESESDDEDGSDDDDDDGLFGEARSAAAASSSNLRRSGSIKWRESTPAARSSSVLSTVVLSLSVLPLPLRVS